MPNLKLKHSSRKLKVLQFCSIGSSYAHMHSHRSIVKTPPLMIKAPL